MKQFYSYNYREIYLVPTLQCSYNFLLAIPYQLLFFIWASGQFIIQTWLIKQNVHQMSTYFTRIIQSIPYHARNTIQVAHNNLKWLCFRGNWVIVCECTQIRIIQTPHRINPTYALCVSKQLSLDLLSMHLFIGWNPKPHFYQVGSTAYPTLENIGPGSKSGRSRFWLSVAQYGVNAKEETIILNLRLANFLEQRHSSSGSILWSGTKLP